MAASASVNPSSNGMAAITMARTADRGEVSTRETIAVVRDTIVVLGIQVVFRTMMFLRKLNY